VAQSESRGHSRHQTASHWGPAQARNAGAKTARSQIVFFVDADVVIPPDALTTILDVFADDAGLAARHDVGAMPRPDRGPMAAR
jgi:glycosyltransferase involved in cell wall biosynthesis